MMTLAFTILGFLAIAIINCDIWGAIIIWAGFMLVGMALDFVIECIERAFRKKIKKYKKTIDKRYQ